MPYRIVMLCAASPIAFCVWPSLALGQEQYPRKPIRWVSPYAPGGSTSTVARMIGEKVAEALGRPVIIDNRPGGNTMIGSDTVARAAPDGYTLLHAGKSQVILRRTSKPPYDIFTSFAPITTLVKTNYILVVHPNMPVADLKQFVAYAKERPGKLAVASVSSGSGQHLMGELFNIQAGIKTRHIPYKGGQQGLMDLMAGIVHLSFSNAINVVPHVQAGRLKGLAITGEKRTASLPDLPTYAEAGIPEYAPKTWQGVVAPAGTPKAIIDRLSSEMAKVLGQPLLLQRLDSVGMEPYHTGPELMAAQMKADDAEIALIIKSAGLKF